MSQPQSPQPQSLRPFLTIWGGQAFSLIGSQLVQFGLVWYLTTTTGSATVLALASLVAILPQVLLGPLAGALIDRWDRRMVMLTADALVAAATLVLATLFWFDVVQVWHIYTLMFIRAVGGAFHWPAMQASTTLLVPEQHLARIAGFNQGLMGAANIISPPIGALLITVMPLQGVLLIDVVTAALAIIPLLFVHIPSPIRQTDSSAAPPSVWSEVRGGLSLVGRWQALKYILVMAMLINLLMTPAFSLLPILVTRFFGGGALELAWMEASWGVGMVAGGLLLGIWGGFRNRMVTTAMALTLMGVGLVVVGLVPASGFYIALTFLFLSGIMNPIVNGSLFAALQSTVPADMQGRIFTLIMSGSTAMAPLGLIVAGPIADLWGTQFWMLVGGLITVMMGLSIWFMPILMNFEEDAHKLFVQTI